MVEEQKETLGLPTVEELCLEVALYKSIPLNDTNANARWLHDVENFTKNFDCYCVGCGRISVFQSQAVRGSFIRNKIFNPRHISLYLECSRNQKHDLLLLFIFEDMNIIKIGQYPSMADLASSDIQKYRKILDNDSYKEFSRSVGLISHGVGIGAFVYLRRIFEKLISEAYEQTKLQPDWEDDIYQKSRMDEKIGLLQNYLPVFLVENKVLYSILSKGIHDLTEVECLEAFPVIKLGIELILDEKIQEKKRKDKIKVAKKSIGQLSEQLK